MKKGCRIGALCLLAACAATMSGWAQQKLSDEEAYRRFVGTWVNEVYPGDMFQPEMRVIRADRVGEDRLFASSRTSIRKTGAGLMRVDKAGKVWEANFSWGAGEEACPKEIDTEAREYVYRYFIYYRK